MAHAGTMVGGSAQTKQSGSPWPAVALAVAVAVATIAGVWLASSAGLVGGTAKPAADQSYDQIEAQLGAITVSSDAYLNGILDRAHATPYVDAAVTLSSDQSRAIDEKLNGILDRAHATPYAGGAVTLSSDQSRAIDENLKFFDRAHAAPYVGGAPGLPFSATSGTFHAGQPADPLSATSGTFHPGNPADQVMAPAKRDRVGGP